MPATPTISPGRADSDDAGEGAALEVADLQDRGGGVGHVRLRGEGRFEAAPDDQAEHLVVADRVDVADPAHLAVAQDRDAIGDDAHLGQAVGDVDDRRPGGGDAADVAEEHLHRLLVERRRRLVEDQHGGLDRQRLGELEEVLVDDRQGVDAVVEVRLEADLVEDPADLDAALATGGGDDLGQGDADVLGDGHVGQQRRVLVDDGDAELRRRGRREAVELRAVDLDRAAVGGDRARGDVHQRRLARPVLAEEGVDLAGGHLQADVGEGAHRSVALGDVRQDDPRLPGGRRFLLCFDGEFEFVHAWLGWWLPRVPVGPGRRSAAPPGTDPWGPSRARRPAPRRTSRRRGRCRRGGPART